MKFLTFCFIIFFNLVFGQNDLEIKIINDTIKKVSYLDDCQIFYTITNNSSADYYFVLDKNEFNAEPEYVVEPPFFGLPEYIVYKDDKKILPKGAFTHDYNSADLKEDEKPSKIIKYSKKLFNDYDYKIAYRSWSKLIKLRPKESKIFMTRVNFPYYKGRSISLVNK